MMDGEKEYRTRLAECLAAAEAAASPLGWTEPEAEDAEVDETDYVVPDPVVEAIDGGMPAIKAFRQSSGQAQHDVAAEAGMSDERLAEIEQGDSPAPSEMASLSDALDVPTSLLKREGS